MKARSIVLKLEGLACLVAARVCVAAFPFRWTRAWLGRASPAARCGPGEDAAAALKVAGTIQWLCARAPALGSCLPQAMAAAAMLRRRNIPHVAHFGVIPPRDGSALEAHVWVTASGVVVTGGDSKGAYAEIGKLS